MIKKYCGTESYKLFHGNMLEMADAIENRDSVDAIVCDPPYELNFMGKGWDNAGISFNPDTWKKCYDVLKPGGYLLAFGGSRTFHRIACAIEDAGFEIRDTIMWLYGSGFPKSMDIGKAIDKKNGVKPIGRKEPTGGITGGKNTGAEEKGWHSINNWYEYPECSNEWKGWGTALKPAYEPIIVARKPFKGSCVDNVMEYGVGGMNIDECRVEYQSEQDKMSATPQGKCTSSTKDGFCPDIEREGRKEFERPELIGRFPANVILDSQDGEDWRRYFYCAKASKKDRDEGLDGFEDEKVNDGRQTPIDNAFQRGETLRKNTHPTVKPTELMRWLVRLVAPRGGVVLDPFMGSGSTGKAVMLENNERNAEYKFIGIELTDEYLPIAQARIQAAKEAK